jgi:hypothetical protein
VPSAYQKYIRTLNHNYELPPRRMQPE